MRFIKKSLLKKPWQWVIVLWLGGIVAATALSMVAKVFIYWLKTFK